MKKYFLIIVTIALFGFKAYSTGDFKIAEISTSGTITFVVSTTTLIANWNTNLMNLSGIDADLSSIVIEKDADNNYFAKANGAEYRSVTLLTVVGNEIFAYMMANEYTITCTSKICASEPKCLPKDGGICAPACEDCVKTTTIGHGIMNY